MRNYQRRKVANVQLQVKSLQDKLTLANDHIYDLEHCNTQANLAIEKLVPPPKIYQISC